jgi:hypothetical protein
LFGIGNITGHKRGAEIYGLEDKSEDSVKLLQNIALANSPWLKNQ